MALFVGVMAALGTSVPAIAAPAQQIRFEIPEGPLSAALVQYAHQTGDQLLYDANLLAGRRSVGLKATLAPDEALRRLLAGTDIIFQRTGPKVLVLRRRPTAAGANGSDVSSGDPVPPPAAQAPQVSEIAPVVVTGSLIHGAGKGPSPIIVLDRSAIERSGYATVSDALEALPQNFNGSGTPATALTASDASGLNTYYSSGVNLRGLGNEATLVLINGRRIAGTGYRGDFADLSTIPTAAVERIDVLLDGASALYGSDAVGGVVNVVLKHDFEGAESRVRVGGAAGGGTEYQVAQTVGYRWASGNILASYEFYRQDALPYAARPFTASGDLRPFGGADQRSNFSHPGNIVVFDPTLGAYRVGWAIPAGQDGVGLTPGDFLASQRNPGEPNEGADVLPQTTKHNVYVAAQQQVSSRVTLSGDIRFSDRSFAYSGTPSVSTLTVTTANPYFVSPNGATSERIAYNFFGDVGSPRGHGRSDSLGVSLGANIDLGRDWRGEVYAAYSQEVSRSQADHIIDTAFLREALGSAPDDPKTAYSAARDGYFNPFGNGHSNNRTVLDFINSGHSSISFRTQVASVHAQADGTLFALPGGAVKLAVGTDLRRETYTQSTTNLHVTDSPVTTIGPLYERNIVAGFAELRAPLVSDANGMFGLRRLEVSAAGRIERYDDVGVTTNPKFGLLWSPTGDLDVRFTYGRSFRAPALSEVFSATQIGATFLPATGGQILTLYKVGGNPDLKPERATTLTAGFDYAPRQVPGLRLSATWFDTRFTDRIEQPVLFNLASALTDPALAAFVTHVDGAKPADLALVQSLISDPRYVAPGAYPADAFGAIVDARFVNSTEMRVSGVDITAHYGFEVGGNRVDLDANASHLYRYARRLTAQSAPTSYLDTPANPVDLRARGSATWTRGEFGLTFALNYVTNYHDLAGARIDAWTTADLQLQWRSRAASGALHGLTATASVRNLFDTAPPFYNGPSPLSIGYDAANADPLGRFASLQITKRW